MCERCWGKAFTAAYGIGSKTQAGEYERIVASCACTPAQRRGVTDSFAEGYTAREKEIEQLRTSLMLTGANFDSAVKEIEELRAKLEAVPDSVMVGAWQLEELLKYADLAEVALRTGFHPPEFLFEPADRSLRQCIDAIKEQRDRWLATVAK